MSVRIRQVAHHETVVALGYRFDGPGSEVEVAESDADELLALTFEMTPCCGQRSNGATPMFELADPPPEAQADNKTEIE